MTCDIKESWIEIEKEHTKDRNEAKKIVSDHIREHGCSYYPELIKFEKRLDKKK